MIYHTDNPADGVMIYLNGGWLKVDHHECQQIAAHIAKQPHQKQIDYGKLKYAHLGQPQPAELAKGGE